MRYFAYLPLHIRVEINYLNYKSQIIQDLKNFEAGKKV